MGSIPLPVLIGAVGAVLIGVGYLVYVRVSAKK
jgi:hypothetical protein